MLRTNRLRGFVAASLLVLAAACGGDAGTDDAGTGENTILPADATGADTAADVGDMGTGTGDAQSGGDLTGEVPDSVAGGTTP